MSEALKILNEGVEQDLYKLMRDPHTPDWLRKFFHKAVSQPDHAHTAQWLRKLADALDGGSAQEQSQAPEQPNQAENPQQKAQEAPKEAPNGLKQSPFTQGESPFAGKESPFASNQEQPQAEKPSKASHGSQVASQPYSVVGDDEHEAKTSDWITQSLTDKDSATRWDAMRASMNSPDWLKAIVKNVSASNDPNSVQWMDWLANLGSDEPLTHQKLAGLLSNDKVPQWVKNVIKAADASPESPEEMAKILAFVGKTWEELKGSKPKSSWLDKQNKKAQAQQAQVPQGQPTQKQPAKKPATARDILGDRYDGSLSHGDPDDDDETTHQNVDFGQDDDEEDK